MTVKSVTTYRFTCDRCGVNYDAPEEEVLREPKLPSLWVKLSVRKVGYGVRDHDLCPRCASDLGDFVRGHAAEGVPGAA